MARPGNTVRSPLTRRMLESLSKESLLDKKRFTITSDSIQKIESTGKASAEDLKWLSRVTDSIKQELKKSHSDEQKDRGVALLEKISKLWKSLGY